MTADDNFPLSHSALSEAWYHLGYLPKSRAEAERALQLSHQLPQEDRLLVEGQYWRAMQNWSRAVEAYQALFRRFPDNLDYGLLLATAQIETAPAQSLQTLAALRRLPAPAGEDARIDMTEASAWISQDLAKAQAAARIAIRQRQSAGIARNCRPHLRLSLSTGRRHRCFSGRGHQRLRTCPAERRGGRRSQYRGDHVDRPRRALLPTG